MTEKKVKTGRPRKELDKAKFEELCINHFTKEAIARYFCVDTKTLEKWVKRTYLSSFSDFLEKKRAEGNNALIKLALAQASETPSILIFLLKNWCRYSDNPKDETAKNTGFGGDLLKWFDNTKIQTDATSSVDLTENEKINTTKGAQENV